MNVHIDITKKYIKNHVVETRAGWLMNYYKRKGKLVRSDTCEKCGKECLTQGHHQDYSKPLDITWLCQQCHIELHRGKALGRN